VYYNTICQAFFNDVIRGFAAWEASALRTSNTPGWRYSAC